MRKSENPPPGRRAATPMRAGRPRQAPEVRSGNGRERVQSIGRALTLLEALRDGPGEVGIAALSKEVGLHVSTTHRLLATLVARGYARQNAETGRYALGPQSVRLAEAYLAQLDLRGLVHPWLERLSRETGETSNLVVLEGREVLYLDKVESPQSLRYFSRIGHRAPLHCTAVGKVLLAYRPRAEAEALLGQGRLEALTPRTIVAPSLFWRELQQARLQGFALDQEECEEGASCIAAPLHNAAGQVEGALSVSGPAIRLTSRRLAALAPLMRRTADEISAELGYRATV